MGSSERRPVLRYYANTIDFYGPVGLLGSYVMWENRIPIKVASGAWGIFFYFSSDQTQ